MDSLFYIIANFNTTWQRIVDVFDSNDENKTSHLIQLFTCGRNMSSLFDHDQQGPARHFEELRQQMKNEREVFIKNDDFIYVYDNTTSKNLFTIALCTNSFLLVIPKKCSSVPLNNCINGAN